MKAFLGNEDPRPVLAGRCRDAAQVRTMLSILKHVEANYDSPRNPSRRAQG